MSPDELDGLFAALAGGRFVAFDLETTGLSPQTDRVVEIGAVRFAMAQGPEGWEARPEDVFESLVHPGRAIPATISAIHGISDLDVAQSPVFAAAATRFFPFLEGALLVAHNATFDLGFLVAESDRCGLLAPLNMTYDTMKLARAAVPGLPSYSLRSLAASFGVAQRSAHRGADDARVCMELFARCVRLLAKR